MIVLILFLYTEIDKKIYNNIKMISQWCNKDNVIIFVVTLPILHEHTITFVGCAGIHMYSLNQDKSAVAILQRLGLLDPSAPPRALPFRARTCAPNESVRPVCWINRPKSYLKRTSHWTTFPQNSWSEAKYATNLSPHFLTCVAAVQNKTN